MSTVSLSFYKARQGYNWYNSVVNPTVMGYLQPNYVDQGVVYRMPVSVTAGYTVKKLTFTIGNISGHASADTNVYAVIYSDDPTESFSNNTAPANFSWRNFSKARIEGDSGTSYIVVSVDVDITSTKEYFLFLTTDSGDPLAPFMRGSTNISCSLSEVRPETPVTTVSVSTTPYMDRPVQIYWTPYTPGYKYKVFYSFVNHSGAQLIGDNITEGSMWYTFESQYLASSIPNSISGSLRITVDSYNSNGTQVGTTYSEFQLNIPTNNRIPTCDEGWALASYEVKAGTCVAGFSEISATVDTDLITCHYSSTLREIRISCNSSNLTVQASGTVNLGKAISGNNVVTVTVYDSRGFNYTYTKTIVGNAYAPPSFNSLSIIRCDSTGAESSSGTYYAVTPSVAYTSYGGNNSLTIKTRWQVFGGSYSSYTNINNGVQSAAQGGGNIATTSSYLIEVVAVDSIGQSSTQTRTLTNTSVAATLNLKSNGLGAAFFGLSSTDKELTVFGRVGVTPTIDDVKFDIGNYDGAMLISVGGKDRGGGNGIYKGNGDGIVLGNSSNSVCNIAIKSWYGVGFVDGCSGNGITAGIDCRNGDIYAKRDLRAGSWVYANRLQLANAGGNGIWRDGSGTSWIEGRDGALLRNGTNTNAGAFWPITSCKAPSGTWDVGVQGDNYCFVYNSDANYDTKDNEHSPVIVMFKDGSLNTPGWITTVGINIGAGGLVLADIGANAGTVEPLSDWGWDGRFYFQYS